mgnify:FL=1
MNKTKILTATTLILLLITFSFLPKDKEFCVKNVISPTEIQLDNDEILKFDDIQTFDANYSLKNKELATKLGITEDEAFIIGNLAKYWSQNLLSGRDVLVENGDLIYYKYSYQKKLENSAFGLINGKPCKKFAFNRLLNKIRHTKYGIYTDNKLFPISKDFAQGDFIVMRKSHYYRLFPKAFVKKAKGAKKTKFEKSKIYFKPFSNGNIKIIVSDLTTKLKPDRNCSSDICKEILTNINTSKVSIDMAIYGYSSTPAIEKAIKDAQNRGVKIRLIYDVDAKNQNIYPDTFKFVNLIANSKSDSGLKDSNATMHNKFYIFDNKIVITGSANLSHTDMSGFNSNNIIVINSADVAKIYKTEFEQMFNGNFHSAKIPTAKNKANGMQIYFSPQDKSISNAVLPIIENAKDYIYIPIFVITENRVVEALIKAKQRGVDVRLISDALNASSKYSKIKVLRASGIPVKIENYAGKMHSKTMIVDDKYSIIGSMNFSKSGETKNDENTIVLENAEATKYLKRFFLYQWDRIPDKWLTGYPRAEGWESVGSCSDGIDNDYDGSTDAKDSGCHSR